MSKATYPMKLPVSIITRLKAELTKAFAAPDSAYKPLDANTVIKRNARKRE